MGRAGCLRSAGLLGVAVLAAACTADAPSSATTSDPVVEAVATGTASPEDTAEATPRAADEARTEADALAFTARRLEGGTFDGQDHAGSPVVLWMWAPWCPQCNREAPHVADAVDRFGDQVTFVGVPGHDTDEAYREFVEEHGLEDVVQAVDDDDGSLWARFGVNYQPAWVFVDEDGGAEVVAGGLYDDLAARIQALVDG